MSRKACLLTQKDVPHHIKEIVQMLHPVSTVLLHGSRNAI